MAVTNPLLAKIAAAKSTAGGVYIKPGDFVFEIENVIIVNGFKGPCFVAEFLVLEAVQTDPEIKPNPVGSHCSIAIPLNESYGPGNAKAFIMGVFDESEDTVTVEALDEVVSAANPCRFMRVKCRAFNKPKKAKPGEVFTAQRWEHIAPTAEDLAKIAERRAAEAKAPKA